MIEDLKPVFGVVFLVVLATSASLSGEEIVDFDREIRPILSNHCYQCHGPDANTREAELRLDVKSAALGKAAMRR